MKYRDIYISTTPSRLCSSYNKVCLDFSSIAFAYALPAESFIRGINEQFPGMEKYFLEEVYMFTLNDGKTYFTNFNMYAELTGTLGRSLGEVNLEMEEMKERYQSREKEV